MSLTPTTGRAGRRIPGHFAMRPVSGAPSRRQPPPKRKLDTAEGRNAQLVALALDDERACVPGVLFEPFGPGPAHIVQLRPVAIRQMSHASIPRPPSPLTLSRCFAPRLAAKRLRMGLFAAGARSSRHHG